MRVATVFCFCFVLLSLGVFFSFSKLDNRPSARAVARKLASVMPGPTLRGSRAASSSPKSGTTTNSLRFSRKRLRRPIEKLERGLTTVVTFFFLFFSFLFFFLIDFPFDSAAAPSSSPLPATPPVSAAAAAATAAATAPAPASASLLVPFMDSSIDSDHSWESHSTGSSGRGTQHSDQGSLGAATLPTPPHHPLPLHHHHHQQQQQQQPLNARNSAVCDDVDGTYQPKPFPTP